MARHRHLGHIFGGHDPGVCAHLVLAMGLSMSSEPEQAARVADRLDAGMVYVNIVGADSPELPFGGVKRSGTARELGLLAADEFVNKKLIRTAG